MPRTPAGYVFPVDRIMMADPDKPDAEHDRMRSLSPRSIEALHHAMLAREGLDAGTASGLHEAWEHSRALRRLVDETAYENGVSARWMIDTYGSVSDDLSDRAEEAVLDAIAGLRPKSDQG
jgi:hypothetical protein